jgi:hypothetical protein
MKDSKNQIIRSSKSFETGGTSDTCFDGGDKKCKKTRRVKVRSSGNNDGSGALAGGLMAGVITGAGLQLKKMLKKEKVGGPVKNKMQFGGCIGDDPTTGKKCVKKPKRPLANGTGGNGLSNLGSNIKDLFRKKNRPSSRAKRLRSN